MPEAGSKPRTWGVRIVLGVVALVGALAGVSAWWAGRATGGGDSQQAYADAISSGKTLVEKGQPDQAAQFFQQALAMNPANPDAHLAMANALLKAGQTGLAGDHAREALRYEPGNAAALYLIGCAALRQNQFSNAVQALDLSKQSDRTVNAVSLQLGRAWFGLGRFDEAAAELREALQFETNTTLPSVAAAHYLLGQSLLRLGKGDEAARELAEHQRLSAGKPGSANDPSVYESCVYTEIHAPFPLEQPDLAGVTVRFVDATQAAFGSLGGSIKGPAAAMDVNHRGAADLLACNPGGVTLLWNSNGVFSATHTLALPAAQGAERILVGDLQNDRFDDAVLIGPNGVAALRFATNGFFEDATRFSGLAGVSGRCGTLGDLDFTGKLGLWLADNAGALRAYTNLGYGTFRAAKAAITAAGVTDVVIDDWNNDDLPDLILVRDGQPPLLALNVRGSGLGAPATPESWPAARAAATGDFNNDLRTDIAFVTDEAITVVFGGLREPLRLPARGRPLRGVKAVDYDNDGWLDILAWGDDGLRVWRNRGHLGFHETTRELALDGAARAPIRGLAAADFDNDGDIDVVYWSADGGLHLLRNDGGNANGMLRLLLLGNRSNASGLGVKVELSAGGWRALRTVQTLPAEFGVGRRAKLDAVTTRWFETKLDITEVDIKRGETLPVFELIIPGGSCPYLYTWNGTSNRFVTDILGAAPAGLPVAPGRYISADTDEFVWLGDDQSVAARNGRWVALITEELKEALYLDTAGLLVADHPANTEAHSESRLVPKPPFRPAGVAALTGRRPLLHAEDLAGRDLTAALRETDGVKASPDRLLGSHYRGLAETWGFTLDFGPIDPRSPAILALTGWLRFGGGMANIAASQNPDLPFPFPTLEAEANGQWSPVDVTVGAPSGKTKTILVELTGRLPAGARRLRLKQAFEIHWDRAALFTAQTAYFGSPVEAAVNNSGSSAALFHWLRPASANLHWRGYSEYLRLPWTEPLTPVYSQLRLLPPYWLTPSGWATRYGPVDALVAARDDALAIIAGGDELTLEFDPASVPAKPAGWKRDFFLFVSGWDKDADYHVAAGDLIDPLPWHGMDDQRYGREPRPPGASDELHRQFNTRWVGPRTFARRP